METVYKSQQLFEKVQEAIIEVLGIHATEVTLGSNFVHDLGMDSLDGVELEMTLEEKFDIEIYDGDMDSVKTVEDLCDYMKKKVKVVPSITTKPLPDAVKFTRVQLDSSWTSRRQDMVDGNQKEFTIPAETGLTFKWAAQDIGFGEFSIIIEENGQIRIKAETMGKKFVELALAHWLKDAVVVE